MTHRSPPDVVAVAPLAITPRNSELLLGVPWRWLKDHAQSLGLTIYRVDTKPFIDGPEAMRAVRKHGAVVAPEPAGDEPSTADAPPLDEREAMRQRLGKRRRTAC